jgi:hypothetical protein
MKKKILLAAVMFLALSVSAFAQASFTVASEVIDRVACCGLAEPTGAIQFTVIPTSPATVTGTFTIRYSVPIANAAATGAQAVQVAGGALASTPINDSITGNGIIVIAVPPSLTQGNIVKLYNVRVNVSTSCGTSTPVTAAVSSVGNYLTSGELNVTVLNGTQKPLSTPTATVATVNPVTAAISSNPVINVQEGFLNVFGVTVATDPTQTVAKIIRLQLTGTLPTGASLTFPTSSGSFILTDANGAAAAVAQAVTTLPMFVYYKLNVDSNPAVQETFSVTPTLSIGSATLPLNAGTILVSATMGPISSSATVFPRYTADCETSATVIVRIEGALTTNLLVPYLTEQASYSTGFAIANTTKDPGSLVTGMTSPVAQPGKITIYFYPANSGAPTVWVSTAAENLSKYGLDANGKLLAGGLFTAMVSQLLPASAVPFSGYAFIVTDFTNAHGEYFISNFSSFTHGALMLVLSTNRLAPEGLNN